MQALKLLKSLASKFSVFKPRNCLLRAYWKYSQKKTAAARKLSNKAVKLAYSYGCKFDEEWMEACMLAWFGSESRVLGHTDMFILQ